MIHASLFLRGYRQRVHLGVGEEERKIPQWVRFDLELRFPKAPEACRSDELSETACYAALCERIREICEQKEFRLIEKLGWEVFHSVRNLVARDTRLMLTVCKEAPPIPGLEHGASFTLSDWEPA